MDDCLLLREAAASGIGRGQLNGPGWLSVSHGLYARQGREQSLLDKCRHLGLVLPAGAKMSHFTSGSLRSMWLPDLPEWLPVMATLPPDTDRPERRGLYVARSRAGTPPADIIGGVPVLTPELTLGQLAEDLGLVDLVAAIDSALHQSMCDELDIIRGIRSRQRGLPMLRRALTLCDSRSESPWETFLRLVHTTVGIPVSPQEFIEDQRGRIVARADLRIVGTLRLPEYDGGPPGTVPAPSRSGAREGAGTAELRTVWLYRQGDRRPAGPDHPRRRGCTGMASRCGTAAHVAVPRR